MIKRVAPALAGLAALTVVLTPVVPAAAATQTLGWAKHTVYVEDHTNASWQVHSTIERLDDHSALNLVWVKKCPAGVQCVRVRLGSLPGNQVGETALTYTQKSGSSVLRITKAGVVLDGAWGKTTSAHYRRADVCHEVGHAVGLDHAKTNDTCMHAVITGKTPDHPSSATYALLRKLYPAKG
ncbi:MAG: Matrixin [Friedmanniella sp.]|nr:Matrixin [Friedmanniella sp.]